MNISLQTIYNIFCISRTMKENECNILNNMSRTEFKEFRSLMIEMVLHTGRERWFNRTVSYYKHLLKTI